VAGLAALTLAHRMAIGFENFDIALGRGIAIDGASVFEKLVMRGRGGYCFEQNRLFSDMLRLAGLANRPLLARVRLAPEPGVTPPRTHVCLLAEIAGETWLADAGFGGSFVPPMRLADGSAARSDDGARHRLHRIGASGSLGGEWLLERAGIATATDGRAAPHGDWQAQYTFDLGEVAAADLEQANHWTSTRPGTRFTTLHVASIVLPHGFAALTDRALTVDRGGRVERRTIDRPEDYARLLGETFHIGLGPDEVARLALFSGSGS
jgi:N-hydroxyarylamine O-acetyltransferase